MRKSCCIFKLVIKDEKELLHFKLVIQDEKELLHFQTCDKG